MPRKTIQRMWILITPPGWIVEPAHASVRLDSNAETHLSFTICSPTQEANTTAVNRLLRRARIAADVTIGDHHFGQHAESLITTIS